MFGFRIVPHGESLSQEQLVLTGLKKGTLRGFLNDGTVDYSIHHHPQSLAFGHCDIHYRNLGRLTYIKTFYSKASGLRVEVDGQTCFESNKISLPHQYRYGVSAASADTPDSFEVFGFKVGGFRAFSRGDQLRKNAQQGMEDHARQQQEQRERRLKDSPDYHRIINKNFEEEQQRKYEQEDTDAKKYKTHDEQFVDLHGRLQALVRITRTHTPKAKTC